MGPQDRDGYYREIAAFFLRRRGAPLILSAREFHLLAAWEKQGIPRSAVREGIESAFQSLPRKAGPGRRAISLQYCDRFVQRAFDQVKERRAGGRRPAGGRGVKRDRMLRAVRKFLAALPAELLFLKGLYEQALRLAEAGADNAQGLEDLESEIEEALAAHCPAEEWARARSDVGRLGQAGQGDERAALVRRLALKNLREKFGIPYVSFPFY